MFTQENQPQKDLYLPKKRQQEPSWMVDYRKELQAMHIERMELEKEKLKLEERRVAALEKLFKDN